MYVCMYENSNGTEEMERDIYQFELNLRTSYNLRVNYIHPK